MFNPTIELNAVVDGQMSTILRKEIVVPTEGFPETLTYRGDVFILVDWQDRIHAVYEKTTTLEIKHEPVVPA